MTVNVNSKTWVVGTDITISGGRGYSDPANVPAASPLYTETWEGLANGAGIAGRGNAEVTWNATSANVRASTDRGYGGSSVSLKAAWPAGVQPNTDMPFSLATEVPTIYVGFRLFVPSNFYNTNTSNTGGGSVNKKFFAVWNGTDGYSGYNDCILEYTPDGSGNGLLDPTFQDETSLARHLQGYLTTNGLMPSTPLIDTATDLNRWVTFCIQVTRATSASGTGVNRRGNGILKIWKDGALYFQMLDYPNFTTGSKGYDDGYLIGAANGGFAVDTNLYVDDVVFGTEYGAMTGYVP